MYNNKMFESSTRNVMDCIYFVQTLRTPRVVLVMIGLEFLFADLNIFFE